MVPSRPSKMKLAGRPLASTKSVVVLKTMPVGDPTARPAPPGMVTTVLLRAIGLRLPSARGASPEYSVDNPVCWSDTQNDPAALKAMPQAFLRLGSTTVGAPPAGLDTLETRF